MYYSVGIQTYSLCSYREVSYCCSDLFVYVLGEFIKNGIQEQFVMSEDQAIVLQATNEFEDDTMPGKSQFHQTLPNLGLILGLRTS